jgi:transposase InsO family protein
MKICALARQYPSLGTEELSETFREITGKRIHQSTVWRILRRNKVRYVRKWDGIEWVWQERSPKLYVLDTPWREVQVDACFPFGYSRPETQYDALDDCTRFVFSRLHSEKSVRSSIEFVWNLIHASPFHIQSIRTDEWSEFGKGFAEFLTEVGIEHIRNPPYTPEHNGKVERYHRTLWKWLEKLWGYNLWCDVHEYRYKLRLFTDWYNHKKPHRWLWMFGMTPVQKLAYCLLQHSLQVYRESEDPWGETKDRLTFRNVKLTLQNNKNEYRKITNDAQKLKTKN